MQVSILNFTFNKKYETRLIQGLLAYFVIVYLFSLHLCFQRMKHFLVCFLLFLPSIKDD